MRRDAVRPGAAERVPRATLLRYVDRPCDRCDTPFQVLPHSTRTSCYDCNPAKGRRKP